MNPTIFQLLPVDDNARFVILPFEHRGAKFDSRPQLTVHFPRYEATFELKGCREWLFFRALERPDAVFAIPNLPLGLHSLENCAQWLELALESEQFSRFVVMEGAHPYGRHLHGPFLFFFGADGRGFVREPWDDDGPTFEWNSAAVSAASFLKLSLQPLVEQTARLLGDGQNKVSRTLFSRDISDEQRSSAPLKWLCGSREELAQLTRALLHSQSGFWNEVSRAVAIYTSESEYGRATLYALFRFFFDGQSQAHIDGRLRILSDLFLDFNTPLGYKWEYRHGYIGRASWESEGQEIVVDVSAPTAHETLESQLFLRDWLEGKIAPEEIETLLS